MKTRLLFLLPMVLLLLARCGPKPVHGPQADNENGTYTNPVIWADFPDNDVIRVEDTYYMITTSMFVFPGVTLLKSKDLVNWEYAKNVVDRMDYHPHYDMEGGDRYSRGQWATSIRHHNGMFYLLWFTMNEGGFLSKASDPEGEWVTTKLPRRYYDPGLFFDDDGRAYVVHEPGTIMLTEVDPETLAPLTEPVQIFVGTVRGGLEGSHMYKINGWYYITQTYSGGDGFQNCLRSKNIYGPYEEKIILRDDMNLTRKGVHQGGFVQTQTGEWWMIIFQDRDGVGRTPTLQPITWVDEWPMLGQDGRAVVTYRKPDVGAEHPVAVLPTSDEFRGKQLGMQWQWNHNPDDKKWSLTERKGWLRLHTVRVADGIMTARNTLTQRMFGPYSTATIEMDTRNMKEGDIAGLCVFQDPHAYIGVKMMNGLKYLVMFNNGAVVDSVTDISTDRIYLRAHAVTITDRASFYYSTDNRNFTKLGNELMMRYRLSIFTGNKFCLFNFPTIATGGSVDINWFRMETKQGPPNLYLANTMIEAEMYDEIYNGDTGICRDVEGLRDQHITDIKDGGWIKFDQIDFGKSGNDKFYARVAADSTGGKIEVRLGSADGRVLSTLEVNPTGGWQKFETLSAPFERLKGKQTIVLKFLGGEGNLMNLNWFSFTENPYSLKYSTMD
jgi:beta-xylosidase